MKILFFGLGSIGHKHVDILKRKHNHELFAYRSRFGMSPTPDGVKDVKSWRDISPDIAFITNPSHMHIQTAIQCAERGVHLFIEKPIDVSTRNLNRLIKTVKEKNLTAYVAYPFRFHSGLNDYRKTIGDVVNAKIVCRTDCRKWRPYLVCEHVRHVDGVLLELYHEIDIAEWLFGEISEIRGGVGPTEALLTMECKNASGRVEIYLNIEDEEEERHISIGDNERFDYVSDMGMFEHQTDFFLKNYKDPLSVANNLEKVVGLFWKVVNFEGEQWETR